MSELVMAPRLGHGLISLAELLELMVWGFWETVCVKGHKQLFFSKYRPYLEIDFLI